MSIETTYEPVTDDDVMTAIQLEANRLEEELEARDDLSSAEREVLLQQSEILRERLAETPAMIKRIS